MHRLSFVLLVCLAASGCASLEGLRAFVQAPRFEQADGRRHEIRFAAPGVSTATGGAAVRLWTNVSNPNPFGVTLGTLRGTLHVEGSRAATVDFPLGLPLQAHSEAEIPIDIIIDFSDVPGLGQAITRAVQHQPITYALEGTISVEAGRFGEPVFGPMTLLSGEIR